MTWKEEYMYWRLIRFFVEEKEYRIFSLSADQREVWLENLTDRHFPMIRIFLTDLDWANQLSGDMRQVHRTADGWKKRFLRKRFQVLNIYVTPLPPVDDYEPLIERPLEGNGTLIETFLFVTENFPESNNRLTRIAGGTPFRVAKEGYEPYESEEERRAVMDRILAEARREKEMFHRGKPRLTYGILAINAFIFLLMELFGGSQNSLVLILFGAKFNPLIVQGEWWRLFTCMFLHVGFFHLFMNSIALYYLGLAVERLYGNVRFAIIYLLSGFCGSLASFVLSPSLSAGASGAIFGCFGALLYFGLVYPHLFFRTMGKDVLSVIALNLVLGIILPGIDMAGHLGGLIGGFLISGMVQLPKQDRFHKRIPFFLVFGLLVVLGLYLGYRFPRIS